MKPLLLALALLAGAASLLSAFERVSFSKR